MTDFVSGSETAAQERNLPELSKSSSQQRQQESARRQTTMERGQRCQRRAQKLRTKARCLPLNSNGRKKKEREAAMWEQQAIANFRSVGEQAQERMRQTVTRPSIYK